MAFSETGLCFSATAQTPHSAVFSLVHELHTVVTQSIDTALDWDQLNSPPINYSLVRPIVQRYVPKTDKAGAGSSLTSIGMPSDGVELGIGRAHPTFQQGPSLGNVLYALMANRIQFITLSSGDLSSAPVQTTRASFCELLAIKVLRAYPNMQDEAALVGELVHGHCAFEGAPEKIWKSLGDDRKDMEEMTSSALEASLYKFSNSKNLLSLPLIQHLINLIYSGRLIYTPISTRSIISDSYVSEQTRRLYVYNPYESGWLDHSRLKVPKWRKNMEFASLMILLILFVSTLTWRDLHRITTVEIIYIVFSFGFVLDEFATSKEHGWTVYVANAWNAFDMGYMSIFLLYFVLRVFALVSHSANTSDLAFDILACAACIIFPRLVFFIVKENVVILALRGMVSSFIRFMLVTILAFTGICFSLWTLGKSTWTVKQIVWLMAQIWFGSSYLGFSASESFHPIFGPIVLISYAALCNVLLITMLIAILSNKFAAINQNAQQEHLFQRVVKTVEGVKSDALFSYLPPINIIAFTILVPLGWYASPRTFHRINVFAIRLTSFPVLIAISAYERYRYHSIQRALSLRTPTMNKIADVQHSGLFDAWLGGGPELLIASVFELGPPSPSFRAESGGLQTPKTSGFTSLTEEDNALTPPSIPAKSKSKKRIKRKNFDSPLAKLFGRPSYSSELATVSDSEATSLKEVRVVEKAIIGQEGDVEQLKKEVEMIRESQLRIEEMLAGILGSKTA
nr:nonselective cation channel [Cryptococcus depauperatus CBS 7855]